MIRLTVDEFVEEVVAEILSYDELGERAAKRWEDKFKKLFNEDKITKDLVNKDMVVLKDEADLFSLVDNYYAAVYAKEEEKYWSGLRK